VRMAVREDARRDYEGYGRLKRIMRGGSNPDGRG